MIQFHDQFMQHKFRIILTCFYVSISGNFAQINLNPKFEFQQLLTHKTKSSRLLILHNYSHKNLSSNTNVRNLTNSIN